MEIEVSMMEMMMIWTEMSNNSKRYIEEKAKMLDVEELDLK